jgi:hypothetical protein
MAAVMMMSRFHFVGFIALLLVLHSHNLTVTPLCMMFVV